jgi:lysophospholipase L1-like esterase
VVGLGDSVMAGTACDCPDLLQQYAASLSTRTNRVVRADNLGSNGAITGDLLEDLRGDARTRSLVASADVVVVVVGANDLLPQLDAWRSGSCDSSCFGPPVQQMGGQLGRVLAALQSARNGRTDHVLVTDYWNVFQDGKVARDSDGQAGVNWSTKVTTAANTAICRAAQSAQATCVDLFVPFKGLGERDPTSLLADDGDHPNAAGTRVIVQALMGATPDDL